MSDEYPRIRLRTAGNTHGQELVFNVSSSCRCGEISDGMHCQLAGERAGFVVDVEHLKEIIRAWEESLERGGGGDDE